MRKDPDIIIIGGGPAGLHMIFQAGMHGMRSLLIDALPEAGGQLTALYPEKYIYDIPGIPQILAQNLVRQLQIQAEVFEPIYHWGEQVNTLEFSDGKWSVATPTHQWQAPVVVLAGGIGAFAPKKPRCMALENFETRAEVLYHWQCVRDWQDRRVLIQGAGPQAVEAAITAARHGAREINLVHRKDAFEPKPDQVDLFEALRQNGRIRSHIPYTVSVLEGNPALTSAVLKGYGTADRQLEADLFLPMLGYGAALGPIKEWALSLEHGAIPVDPASMESTKRQLFIIGDLARYTGKNKLILTGFSEAAIAARHSFNYIYPGKRLPTAYSSNLGPLSLDITRPSE